MVSRHRDADLVNANMHGDVDWLRSLKPPLRFKGRDAIVNETKALFQLIFQRYNPCDVTGCQGRFFWTPPRSFVAAMSAWNKNERKISPWERWQQVPVLDSEDESSSTSPLAASAKVPAKAKAWQPKAAKPSMPLGEAASSSGAHASPSGAQAFAETPATTAALRSAEEARILAEHYKAEYEQLSHQRTGRTSLTARSSTTPPLDVTVQAKMLAGQLADWWRMGFYEGRDDRAETSARSRSPEGGKARAKGGKPKGYHWVPQGKGKGWPKGLGKGSKGKWHERYHAPTWFEERAAFEEQGGTREEWNRLKREAKERSLQAQGKLTRSQRRQQDPAVQARAARHWAPVAGTPASASDAVPATGMSDAVMPSAEMPDATMRQRPIGQDSSDSEEHQQKPVVQK